MALRPRLLAAAVLTVPVAVISMIPPLRFGGWEWAALALAAPVVLWAGWPFHRAAALNARHLAATMDTLISIGTLSALAWSVVALAAFEDAETYFEVGAVVTTLILLGRYLEAGARRRSGAAIRALLALGAKEARVLRDGVEVAVPVEELRVGDIFVVRPGERIATDGVVEEGSSAVDQSMLTGEPVPVEVGPGQEVAGRDREHVGTAARPCHEGRLRDGARADHPARRRGAGREGPDPAARRPGRCRVRADRDRDLAGHARGVARDHG